MAGTQTAGTLIGAVLESVGYHYQSHILDALQQPFQNDVGGFIYLVGIAVAVFHAAIRGEFKLAPWLLIGPPLFFTVVLVRDPMDNAQWVFGRDPRNQGAVQHQVGQVLASQGEAAGGQARVSRVFARYTELVSKTVQEIVAVINDGRDKTDLWFVLKAEIFARMYAKSADTTGLTRLIQHGLANECSRVIELAWRTYDPTANQSGIGGGLNSPLDAARQQAQSEYERLAAVPNIRLDPVARRYLALQRMGNGPHQEREIEERMLQPDINRNFSCLEIWDLARTELLAQAERQLNGLTKDAVINGIDAGRLVNFLSQVNGFPGGRIDASAADRAQAVQTLIRIMAKYILRNSVQDTGRGAFIEGLADRQEIRDINVEVEGRSAMVERARLAAREWAEKARLAAALTNIPFYQGLALYFLGVFFPFFALLLLVPGKHSGFILWFILWLWIKSWDVALAMIMLLDDILFSLLAVGRQHGQQEQPLPVALDAAVRSLREVDPSFQLATYYSVVGVAVVGIPVITAQLIMGSLKGGAGLISQGVNRFGGQFTEGSLTRGQQVAISNLRSLANLNRQEWARQYLANTREGSPREAGSADGQVQGGYGVHTPYLIGQRSRLDSGGTTERSGRLEAARGPVAFADALSGNSARNGLASNYTASRAGSRSGGLDYGISGVNAALKGSASVANKWIGYKYGFIKSDLDMTAAYGQWDAAHSDREKHLVFLGSVYGQLGVPWIGFIAPPPFDKEFERDLNRFINEREIAAEALKQSGDAFNSVWNAQGGSGGGQRSRLWRALDTVGATALMTGIYTIGQDVLPDSMRPASANRELDQYAERMHAAYQRVTDRGVYFAPRRTE